MKRVRQQTLEGICAELAAYGWSDAEIAELVDPKMGIITGLQDLLDELEALRRIDLGTIGPAGDIVADEGGE